jgi:hypothetical protein
MVMTPTVTGLYDVTFTGNFDINSGGNCVCDTELTQMITDLTYDTPHTIHAALYSGIIKPDHYFHDAATTQAATSFNAYNYADSVWIIRNNGTHTISGNMNLTNGAHAENIFYLVKGALTINSNVTVFGNFIALAGGSITVQDNVTVVGRLLSVNGSIYVGPNYTSRFVDTVAPVYAWQDLQEVSIHAIAGYVTGTGTQNVAGGVFTSKGIVDGYDVKYDGTFPDWKNPTIEVTMALVRSPYLVLPGSTRQFRVSTEVKNLQTTLTTTAQLFANSEISAVIVVSTPRGGVRFDTRSLKFRQLYSP